MQRDNKRRFVIASHWGAAFLLPVLLIEGPTASAWLVALFAIATLGWFGFYLLHRGPLAKPGPKLTPSLKSIHRGQHHLLYFAVAAAGVASLTILNIEGTGRALTVLLFLSLLHGVFHLWRHTALFDGALKTITPRFLHRIL